MQSYDIAVIGAGPAGCTAAICAGRRGKKTVLVERNDSIGKKILLTGKGRCNITNIAPLEDFLDKFAPNGQFLRTALQKFSNHDLISFCEKKNLHLKVERQGRVFPDTDRAISVVKVLRDYLSDNNVKIVYKSRLADIKKQEDGFNLRLEDGLEIQSKKVILALGGVSYKVTGSTGDGLTIAKKLGHTVTALKPGLVPLKTKEQWVKQLQGLTLKNISLKFKAGNKKISSGIGELLFTHFGVSGPLILDLSSEIISFFDKNKEVILLIDLKPALSVEQIEDRLLKETQEQGKKLLKNLLKEWLPAKLIDVFINLSKVDAQKTANQLTKNERLAIIGLLKEFKVTITGSLPLEEAMVTCGGVALAEINPRTMESRFVPGLYFAGEMIDVSAASGGYNLQAAFSTGYLAGESAATSVGTAQCAVPTNRL